MKILLTGFNRFGNLESNPSQLVVEEMARRAETRQWAELVTEVLPTEFAGAGNRIAELIRSSAGDSRNSPGARGVESGRHGSAG
jgi:pyrrolidone-carboxylate peptidase